METELFVHFAEIAGVFVGFGALISMRSAHVTDVHDVVYLEAVLGLGVWVVVSALLPIAVNRYGVHDRPLWLWCAVVALALWATFLFIFVRSPETRASNSVVERVDRLFPVLGLPLHIAIAGSLALVILDVWPGVSEALYVTALTAGVVFAGYTLLALTLGQEHDLDPGPPDRPRDQGVARPSTK
jgi:hypothetical protein